MERNGLLTALLAAILCCGAPAAGAAQEQARFSVKAGTFVWSSSAEDGTWSVLVDSAGTVRGDVGDVPFSGPPVPTALRERLRLLAACVVSSSRIVLDGCPIRDPPPPMTFLNVQFGSKHVRVDFCYPSVTEGSSAAAQAHSRAILELLIAVRDLAPKTAYDYRSDFTRAAKGLPETSVACPVDNRTR